MAPASPRCLCRGEALNGRLPGAALDAADWRKNLDRYLAKQLATIISPGCPSNSKDTTNPPSQASFLVRPRLQCMPGSNQVSEVSGNRFLGATGSSRPVSHRTRTSWRLLPSGSA